ncbi:MAG TPA: Uma2 family endonuclease [Candidatus Nanopelagicales bacterium]|nr:Uma2 family endonuclease [Candidatus Nanopelagicales bacterium]
MAAIATADVLAPAPMTLEQWADLDEDEPGELVDGWLVEEEAPEHAHEVIVAWFVATLYGWIVPLGGFVLGSEHKLGVSPVRGRKPDVSLYAPGTRLGRGSLSRTPPRMVLEVISARPRDARRDRLDKMSEYARFGVRSYWLVDPALRMLEGYELGEDGYYVRRFGAAEGRVEVPGFEGLVLDLDALWAQVDRVIGEDPGEAGPQGGED